MKKYLTNRKLGEVICDNCREIHQKPITEIARNLKLGRKMFCSRHCTGIGIANLSHCKVENRYDISQHCYDQIDEYTKFRYYLRNSKKRFKEFNLVVEDLFFQWEKQKGICPYTGFEMTLRTYRKGSKFPMYAASLDRIDSSIGYIKDNIEFVCLPINYMKSTFTKEEVLDFIHKMKQIDSQLLENQSVIVDPCGVEPLPSEIQ